MARQPQLLPPNTIKLQDGRIIDITQLPKTQNRHTYNLRKKNQPREPIRRKTSPMPTKYTIEERQWHTQTTAEILAEHYNITIKQAQSMKYTSKYVLERLGFGEI
jgi:hypothetical protein